MDETVATCAKMTPKCCCDSLTESEFDEYRHVQTVLGFAKIREPSICWRAVAGREATEANEGARRRVVATRGCYTAGPGEERHIGRRMAVLPSKRNILAPPPVKACR